MQPAARGAVKAGGCTLAVRKMKGKFNASEVDSKGRTKDLILAMASSAIVGVGQGAASVPAVAVSRASVAGWRAGAVTEATDHHSRGLRRTSHLERWHRRPLLLVCRSFLPADLNSPRLHHWRKLLRMLMGLMQMQVMV